MNPWEIVSWIGASAVAVLIASLTVAVVVALFKAKPGSKTTRIQ